MSEIINKLINEGFLTVLGEDIYAINMVKISRLFPTPAKYFISFSYWWELLQQSKTDMADVKQETDSVETERVVRNSKNEEEDHMYMKVIVFMDKHRKESYRYPVVMRSFIKLGCRHCIMPFPWNMWQSQSCRRNWKETTAYTLSENWSRRWHWRAFWSLEVTENLVSKCKIAWWPVVEDILFRYKSLKILCSRQASHSFRSSCPEAWRSQESCRDGNGLLIMDEDDLGTVGWCNERAKHALLMAFCFIPFNQEMITNHNARTKFNLIEFPSSPGMWGLLTGHIFISSSYENLF